MTPPHTRAGQTGHKRRGEQSYVSACVSGAVRGPEGWRATGGGAAVLCLGRDERRTPSGGEGSWGGCPCPASLNEQTNHHCCSMEHASLPLFLFPPHAFPVDLTVRPCPPPPFRRKT